MEAVMVTAIEHDEGAEEPIYRVKSILTQEDIDEAVGKGLEIYATDERGLLDHKLFDGAEWLSDERPWVANQEVYEVPSVPYLDQRVDLIQAELEALTDAMLELSPKSAKALALKERAADIRTAIAFDKEADMDEIIGSLTAAPAKEAV